MSDQTTSPLGVFPEALEDPSTRLEPHRWYRTQRTTGPVHYDNTRDCYDVFDYETVKRVLADDTTFSIDRVAHGDATREETNVLSESMLFQDPPRHTELRGTVEDFFKPGAIKELAPDIRAIANELIDDIVDGAEGTFDFVQAFAYPLPVTTIAGVLGIPPEDHAQFRDWSTAAVRTGSRGVDASDRREELMAAHEAMRNYFSDLLENRRAEPKDDLLSRIATSGALSEEEVFGFTNLLLVAGNITTTNLLANAVWCFQEHDLFDDLREEQDSLETAIEEVLRYRSPVPARQRCTKHQVSLGGHELPAGSDVVAWIGAANRDPQAFDNPDMFIRTRHPNRHIAFGHGRHICLGASLARLEARIALSVLLDRFESLTPLLDKLKPSESMIVYGPQSLPVRYHVEM